MFLYCIGKYNRFWSFPYSESGYKDAFKLIFRETKESVVKMFIIVIMDLILLFVYTIIYISENIDSTPKYYFK